MPLIFYFSLVPIKNLFLGASSSCFWPYFLLSFVLKMAFAWGMPEIHSWLGQYPSSFVPSSVRRLFFAPLNMDYDDGWVTDVLTKTGGKWKDGCLKIYHPYSNIEQKFEPQTPRREKCKDKRNHFTGLAIKFWTHFKVILVPWTNFKNSKLLR